MRTRHTHEIIRRMLPIRVLTTVLTAAACISALAFPDQGGDSRPDDGRKSDQTRLGALQPFNSVVGSWRGFGQPKRGSRQGAWQEKTVCRWDFSGDRPAVRFDTQNGRQFKHLALTVDSDSKQLMLRQQIGDESARIYHGRIPIKWPARLQLLTALDADGSRLRCTIEQLSDIRLVMLFERQATSTASYRRIAGIGYTRSGHKLAQGNGNQRECIVTGGQGTIPLVHKGKTWYVCCEGCRQVFEDGPDEVIADYLSRQD